MVAAIMLLMAAAIAGYAMFLFLQRSQKLELIGDEVHTTILLALVQPGTLELKPWRCGGGVVPRCPGQLLGSFRRCDKCAAVPASCLPASEVAENACYFFR